MQLWFYILAVWLLGCLGVMIWTLRVMPAMLAFVGIALGLSGIYIVLAAPFVGAMQLIAYVGGLLVLLGFCIMLTKEEEMRQARSSFSTFLLAFATSGSLLYGWKGIFISSSSLPEAATFRELGLLLVGQYGVMIEIIGLVLLVVLVGVVRLLTKSSLVQRDYG